MLRLNLPPLRERGEDVLLLARHFAAGYARELGRSCSVLTALAERALLIHDWPGNVRELQHVIERAVILAEGRAVIDEAHIDLPGKASATPFSFQ